MSVYKSIMTGLNQAIEYEKGNLKNIKTNRIAIAPLPQYKNTKIREVRMNLKLSQQAFANIMGVSKKTIEAWEAGRNTPQGPALRMLQFIEKEPNILEKHSVLKHS